MNANESDFQTVVALLEKADLCHDDLMPAHMRHFVVVRDGDTIVGAVGLEIFGSDALLRSLVVAESQRGYGKGIQLVSEIETYGRSVGITKLYLLTLTADRFFDRHGYVRIERSNVPKAIAATKEFTSFCPDSAVCMQKQLPAIS